MTAAVRQCGIAIPPGRPVADFDSRSSAARCSARRVTGAPGGGQQAGQSLDDGLLIGTGIDIQQHQIGADDREVRHGVTFGLGLGRP